MNAYAFHPHLTWPVVDAIRRGEAPPVQRSQSQGNFGLGSTKRVASAVGEGSSTLGMIHKT